MYIFWGSLRLEPKSVLLRYRKTQEELLSISDIDQKTKDLRVNKFKRYREGWEAALFCYGMSKVLNTTVYVALHEEADSDAIALRYTDGVEYYTPIQIKELVPESLNPGTDLNKELEKLIKYPTSKDCAFVIHHTRAGRFDLSTIKIPTLQIGSLWVIGALNPYQNRWFLAGDLLEAPRIIEFDFPTTDE